MRRKLHQRVDALLPPIDGPWHPFHVGRIFFPQYDQTVRTASGADAAKQTTYRVLRNLFHKLAEGKPLVLVFEDLHWADASSLAWLAEDASVALTIYESTGRLVRTIEIGFTRAVAYESRSKAIYWNGRNNFGEQVASGIYFYHLDAESFSATCKMVILK